MGKSDTKAVNQDLRSQQATTAANYNAFNQDVTNRRDVIQPQADAERQQVWNAYTQGNETGYISPEDAARLRGIYGPGSSSGSGGTSTDIAGNPLFSEPRGIYSDIGKTGGDFGAYGGYQDFAGSGGFSGTDAANFRSQGNASIPAIYKAMQRELGRGNALQGQYNVGLAAQMNRLGRQGAQEAGAANLNTETALANAIREGRLAGLGGMTNIDSLRTGNRLSAAGGLLGVDQASAAAGNAGAGIDAQNRAQQAANERFLIEAQQSGRLSGLGSLSQLYQSGGSGELQNLRAMNLAGLGQGTGDINQNLAMRSQIAQQPDWWSNIIPSAVGGVTGALTGLGRSQSGNTMPGRSVPNYGW